MDKKKTVFYTVWETVPNAPDVVAFESVNASSDAHRYARRMTARAEARGLDTRYTVRRWTESK